MDTVDQHREIVCQLIRAYARYQPSHGAIATEVIIDPARNHFELMQLGWDGARRVHGVVVHIDIIEGKIWIQPGWSPRGRRSRRSGTASPIGGTCRSGRRWTTGPVHCLA